jgi:hypothetical protein
VTIVEEVASSAEQVQLVVRLAADGTGRPTN